jgi:hypothetical protein
MPFKLNRNINFGKLSNDEKLMLKNRLTHSMQSHLNRKRKIKYSLGLTAASVALIFGVFLHAYLNNSYSAIEEFAETIKIENANGSVKLILSGAQNIEISEKDSVIMYSNLGKTVAIGASKNIQQKTVSKDSVVFNTLLVPYGKRKEIILSDGSKVWLNSGSKLVFPAYFSKNRREVYLEGEAIFEVAHNKNKPFFVQVTNYNVQVLGTVFNISSYKDDEAVRTVLKSGSVQIEYKKNDLFGTTNSVKIVPNTLAVYNKKEKEIFVKNVDVEEYFSWREGVFIFKNDSLASIMKKLSRYYDLEIIIKDPVLAKQTFSGYLDVKEEIGDVMRTIKAAEPAQFNYKITTDKQLIIN